MDPAHVEAIMDSLENITDVVIERPLLITGLPPVSARAILQIDGKYYAVTIEKAD